MIRLHPVPESRHECPYCDDPLRATGWYMPGMRPLADLVCDSCNREFYGDLASGHGLLYPMLLEKTTGSLFNREYAPWFGDLLRESYEKREEAECEVEVESFRDLKRPLLLNCLDWQYGHCLLKLLNAQYHIDHHREHDLVVIVPRFLRWMVPDDVAEVWSVNLPLRAGSVWSDHLARWFEARLRGFDEVHLSVGLSHPDPGSFSIERFTGVRPFPFEEWVNRLDAPKVTLVWREDRTWMGGTPLKEFRRIQRWLRKIVGTGRSPANEQQEAYERLAERLRKRIPSIDVAVVGMGRTGRFADWISDRREERITGRIEVEWCERYASSHVVVGIHGSNMLLPTAHAGATVILIPVGKWSNMVQDTLIEETVPRMHPVRCRYLPSETSVEVVAEVVADLLRTAPNSTLFFSPGSCRHDQILHQAERLVTFKRQLESKISEIRSDGT